MTGKYLEQIREAVSNLNPQEVRDVAERTVRIGLASGASSGFAAMEDFLAPGGLSHEKRLEVMEMLHRIGDPGAPAEFDLAIRDGQAPAPENAFLFDPDRPQQTIDAILAAREELGLALARAFPPFRRSVTQRVVLNISKENALFSLATALPDIVPGVLQLPWAAGEFVSDTAFLTMNQIRMIFLLGAASDRPIGYREQKAEIGSIIAAAFGWRALARQLVAKIPLGGGLIPKAAIAFAGTYVVGASIERLYRIGYGYTRAERQLAYDQALVEGRKIAGGLLQGLRKSGT